jgi:hypothetical protein
VSGLLLYNMPQRAFWTSAHVDVQEQKVAIQLSLHCEPDSGVNVAKVVKETT